MKTLIYNDMLFSLEQVNGRWNIQCQRGDGKTVYVAAGLFSGLPDSEAENRAFALIRSMFPVGVRIIGPDVAHPFKVGDLKIIGPDVLHANFVYWDKESVSSPKQI